MNPNLQEDFSQKKTFLEFLNLSNTATDAVVEAWLAELFRLTNEEEIQKKLTAQKQAVLLKCASLMEHPGSKPYSRQILWRSPHFEIMLARWSHQVSCSPHDHGNSIGFVWYIQGDFEETSFEHKGAQLIQEQTVLWSAGQVTRVNNGEIHSCRPKSNGVSLHIYSPPIQKMKVFSKKEKITYIVSDDCGAWVPEDTSQIVERISWDTNK